MDHYRVCFFLNYASGAENGPAAGVTHPYIKSTFQDIGHDAYQIKENEAYNDMLANVLP